MSQLITKEQVQSMLIDNTLERLDKKISLGNKEIIQLLLIHIKDIDLITRVINYFKSINKNITIARVLSIVIIYRVSGAQKVIDYLDDALLTNEQKVNLIKVIRND
jgi:hypothetical protein